MRKLSLALGTSIMLAGSVFAEEKTFRVSSSLDLKLGGALSGGYMATNNNPDMDSFVVTNFLVNLSGSQKGMFEVGFDIAVGGLAQPTFWNGGMSVPQSFNYNSYGMDNPATGLVWSYITLKPAPVLSIDVGLLPTNVGYEVANTYSNPNITLGTVWFAQPVIYPAVRATVNAGGIDLYAEYNQEFGRDNIAVGSLGEIGPLGYAVSYYDYKDAKNLIDFVGSLSLGMIDLGVNFDYQWLDTRGSTRGYAYGIALYAIPNLGNISLPVRVEYFDEGDTGIYTGASVNAENGYTFTVTPTLKPTPSSYIRAEVAYISTKNKVFGNLDKNNRTVAGIEIGVTF